MTLSFLRSQGDEKGELKVMKISELCHGPTAGCPRGQLFWGLPYLYIYLLHLFFPGILSGILLPEKIFIPMK